MTTTKIARRALRGVLVIREVCTDAVVLHGILD